MPPSAKLAAPANWIDSSGTAMFVYTLVPAALTPLGRGLADCAEGIQRHVVEVAPDQSQFTRRFTERAVRFIEANGNRFFVLYVPHVMPHVPIFASEGRAKTGF